MTVNITVENLGKYIEMAANGTFRIPIALLFPIYQVG